MPQFEAVLENGVLRRLQPVALAEDQRVTVRVDEAAAPDSADQIQFVLSEDCWRAFCNALDAPPRDIPALRKLLTQASVFDGRDAVS